MSTLESLRVTDVTISPLESSHGNALQGCAITANQALWRLDDTLHTPVYTESAIVLERTVAPNGLELAWTQKVDHNNLNTLRFTLGSGTSVDTTRLTSHNITDDLGRDVKPAVRFKDHPEFPGIIYIQRSGFLGLVALNVAGALPGVERIESAASNPGTPASLYQKSTLLMALISPSVELEEGREDLRRILTV